MVVAFVVMIVVGIGFVIGRCRLQFSSIDRLTLGVDNIHMLN